jgi:hypothetical protein
MESLDNRFTSQVDFNEIECPFNGKLTSDAIIINTISKVQWVDFKLENVLVSLHSLKTMGLGSIIFKEWRVTWTFSYT